MKSATEKSRERYTTWEQSAGTTLAVLAVSVATSFYFYTPAAFFIIANAICGTLFFLAWRAGMEQRATLAFILVALALILALIALSNQSQQPFQVLLFQGVGLLAVALFACIFAARRRRFSRKSKT